MVNTAIRWSGLLLIVGAILLGTVIVLVSFNFVGSESLASPLISFPLLVSSILLLLSLPAMYAKQADAAGWLGLAGYALLQTGILLLVNVASMPLRFPTFHPASGENAVDFLLAIALTLGLLLTAIATIRAGVFPKRAGILLLAGTAGFFFSFFVAELLPPPLGGLGNAFLGLLLPLAFAWMGVALLQGKPLAQTVKQVGI